MFGEISDPPQKKIGFFLVPDFAMMSDGAAIEPVRAANLWAVPSFTVPSFCHPKALTSAPRAGVVSRRRHSVLRPSIWT